MQRATYEAARKLGIGQARCGKRLVGVHAHEAVERLLYAGGAPKHAFHCGQTGDFLRTNRAREARAGEFQQLAFFHGASSALTLR